ncbi:MAG: hypothetical protein COB76_00435 [Alphaproteobacteria bacterium]|nr:MAG: hypothetical protein COB76_00435 [Alphaproteobacteria bacterium]
MGEVLTGFNELRGEAVKKSRRVVQVEDRLANTNLTIFRKHKEALRFDVALCLIVEIQRDVLGDETTDNFFKRLCEFRDFYSLYPNGYIAEPRLTNLVHELSIQKDRYPLDAAFNYLMIECEKSKIQGFRPNVPFRKLLSEATNTSEGILLFQEWCKTDTVDGVFSGVKGEMLREGVTCVAKQFSREFVQEFIKISRASINLNTMNAFARQGIRSEKYQLEARGLKNNLRLVVSAPSVK